MLNLGRKDKIADSGYLTIKKNTFRYDDAVIQVSNISSIKVGMAAFSIPVWILLVAIVCFLSFIFCTKSHSIIWICIFLGSGGSIIYTIYKEIIDYKYMRYLIIELNSGKSVLFKCTNQSFLRQVINQINDCMDDGKISKVMNINFKSCNVSAEQIGERNNIY